MNPYKDYVNAYAKLLEDGKSLPLGGFDSDQKAPAEGAGGTVLVFSPHPDDECIVGALALRLMRESGMKVVNVAVTQGSKKERQAARFEELRNACAYLGFGLIQTKEGGLEKINLKSRDGDKSGWAESVGVIEKILSENSPDVILIPHRDDSNSTHVGTHLLVCDAMERLGNDFSCTVCENEFWSAIPEPNLMLESSSGDIADLVAGISFHAGEVCRNPYHLKLPAWLIDNVRRGGELVGGQGGAAPDFAFATLYKMSRWNGKGLEPFYEGGRIVSVSDDPLVAVKA